VRLGLSISLRLTLWFSGIFLCGFIVFGTFVWLDLAWSLSNDRDKALSRRAERLVDLIDHAESEPLTVLQTKYAEFLKATPENRLIQLYSLNGQPILQPFGVNASTFPWPQVPNSKTEYRCNTSFGGRPYRVFVRTVTLHGTPVHVVTAAQLVDNQTLLSQLAKTLFRSIPPMLFLSALAGYFISRRALMPLISLTKSARSISIGNLAARLPVSPSRDELARLAETCNDMLKRLEDAVKAITRFTADASHELRSPIAIIRMTCDYTLRTPGLDCESVRGFESIVKEAEHCSRLIDDMLLLARSDAGCAQLAFAPVYLTELVHQAIARMQLPADEKKQQLTELVQDEDIQITGDAVMLGRLICILLDNAIKYTPAEGHIEVTLAQEDQTVLLNVADDGIGIPAIALPHIFERFYRADPSRSVPNGTGLGLAIAKWIVDAHDAKIIVESTEQVGTKFSVAFRAYEKLEPAQHHLEIDAAVT
jgi:heavy metal sensor kinase